MVQGGTKWHKVAQSCTNCWMARRTEAWTRRIVLHSGRMRYDKQKSFFFLFFLSFLFVFKLSLEIFLSNFNQTEIRNGIGTSRCVVHLIWLTYDFIIIIICIFFCFFFWKWVFSFLSFYKIHVGFRFREWKIWG